MPSIPPSEENITDEKENSLAPNIVGISPPTNIPILINTQIKFFESMLLF